jgi:Zn-dependent metalloprotease
LRRAHFRRVRAAAHLRDEFRHAPAANKERSVYSANNTQRLPGTLVRTEGQPPSGELSVDEAYDQLGQTFDFYQNEYERNSIDNRGLPLNASIHYEINMDNAFWDGQRMVFGDGDGELFDRFTKCLDVTAHELTHGVTQYESNLIYFGQSGALNEHCSDVMGSLVKQYAAGETADQADWLIGEGLLIPSPGNNRTALRSMSAPGTAYDDPVLGKDPQPGDMSGYVATTQDYGGVHINSGIPNRAFYLVATSIGGYAWQSAGLIWYETMRSPRLRRSMQFRGFARLTLAVAQALFGASGPEADAVSYAWNEVGIAV